MGTRFIGIFSGLTLTGTDQAWVADAAHENLEGVLFISRPFYGSLLAQGDWLGNLQTD